LSEHHQGSDSGSESDNRDADEQRGVHDEDMLSARSRGRVWPWFVVMVAIVVAIAAFVVPLPYYVDGPGVVRATQSRVSVSGHPAYESKGEIFFTTVSERRATPYLLLQAWLDEAIDTLPEKVAHVAFESAYEAVVQVQKRRERLDEQITQMARGSVFTPVVDRLACLRGISDLTGLGLAVEIGDWNRFTGASIAAFLGLTPSEHSSGQSRSLGSITKTGKTKAIW